MNPDLPIDPRLKNLDNELIEIVAQEFKQNIDLVGIHLRDARNMLIGVERKGSGFNSILAKATLLLASAALESNLAYLSGIALRFADQKPNLFLPAQLRYLKGYDEIIDDNGRIAQRPTKQSLGQRLQTVPSLLAWGIGRKYSLRTDSASFKKLQRTIQRRDAIVHPRWDKYVPELGWWEAAEAIDSVELYLNSIASTLHPYLIGYFHILYTIPGHDHHDVAVGHRTFGKRGPRHQVSTMDQKGVLGVLIHEWLCSTMLVRFALESECEKDSEGSMLTRAALVLLYAMLDAQLSVVAQWRMRDNPEIFKEAEVLFLNEYAVGVGHDGEVWLGEDHQSFKKRIKAVPAILSRRIENAEASVDLGAEWGKHLLVGNDLRNKVMHSVMREPLSWVTKDELKRSASAIFAYFEEVTAKLPISFEYMISLLRDAAKPGSKFPAI